MSFDHAKEVAFDNLRATYLSVAESLPGVTVKLHPNYVLCTGTFDHPLACFACPKSLNPAAVQELYDIARRFRTFNLICCPDWMGQGDERMLKLAGFHQTSELQVLAHRTSRQIDSKLEVRTVKRDQDRENLAGFFAQMFFESSDESFIDLFVEATLRTPATLVAAFDEQKFVGGAMLTDSGSAVGIYNFSVVPNQRNRGYGASFLSTLVAAILAKNKLPVLQCPAGLVGFYERQGMATVGSVAIRNLALGPTDSIIFS